MKAGVAPELVHEAAVAQGVGARPVISRVTDVETGEARVVPIWCGSTRANRCPACAERAKRLRMQQCREGWHLDTEPEFTPADDEGDRQADDEAGQGGATAAEHRQADARIGPDEGTPARRVRSTRRRQGAPDLPRVPAEDRTIGRVF